jgi:hypothetical protein
MKTGVGFALVFAAFGTVVASCNTTKPTDSATTTAQIGPAPVNFREQIISEAKSSYFDPYSIRSAERTDPIPTQHAMLGHFWVVCIRSNAKNRMGGYVGLKTEAYGFRQSKVVEKSEQPEMYCNGQSYVPFPELEGIK